MSECPQAKEVIHQRLLYLKCCLKSSEINVCLPSKVIFNLKLYCQTPLRHAGPRAYVSGWCQIGVQKVSGRYHDCVWFLEGVWEMSGELMEGAWMVCQIIAFT